MNNSSFTKIIEPKPFSQECKKLSQKLSIPHFVSALLLQRNINTKENARDFFLTHNPPYALSNELLNLQHVVTLLKELLEKKSNILIHGDYDVDGITGTAILYLFLKKEGFSVSWFIPNRFTDGYGMSKKNIEKFSKEGIEWIITVDTGITANQEIEFANKLGIQVIVTDHHQASKPLPPAKLIVNPNQPECNYPNKSLCGAGVAWKIINTFSQKYLKKTMDDLLYLVALASLSDVVEINTENRFLIRKGLRLMPRSKHFGIQLLLNETNLKQNKYLTSTDILFGISPLLNSSGRISTAALSLNLLVSSNHSDAKKYLEKIKQLNLQRKLLEKKASEDALTQINPNDCQKKSCIVLYSHEWHQGIIGIVAARVLEATQKPSIIISCDKYGLCKGSGRSVLGFNLHTALKDSQSLFENWGGHYYACGFSIKEKNIPLLKKNLNQCAETYLPDKFYQPQLKPHTYINISEIDETTMLWLQRFEPCGPGNEKTLFYSKNVTLENIQIVGQKHLKLTVRQEQKAMNAIYFNSHQLLKQMKEHLYFNIVFYIDWNYFRNSKTIQLNLKGIHHF